MRHQALNSQFIYSNVDDIPKRAGIEESPGGLGTVASKELPRTFDASRALGPDLFIFSSSTSGSSLRTRGQVEIAERRQSDFGDRRNGSHT